MALEVLEVLLSEPTDDAVETAVNFMKEIGQFMEENSPRAIQGVFEHLRSILQEGNLDPRVQYIVEDLFTGRKDTE